jgi:DNA/RNA-binding domain of Phe-tRNA-synthetase-like protein
MIAEPQLEVGWLDENLRVEFPELRLVYTTIEASPGRSPEEVKQRLRVLSDRFTGAKAVALRQQPIPWAYRVFFRHVGIDPDEHRTPVEAYALERMRAGGFKSRNILDDALMIATVETGVPVIAFDEDRLAGPLGLRLAGDEELLGGDGRILSSRQVLVADAERSVAVLFADMAEGVGVESQTTRMRLASVQVKGVPDISVEEALWTVVETILGPTGGTIA